MSLFATYVSYSYSSFSHQHITPPYINRYPKMSVEPAPEPSDVIWANIQRKPEEIEYKAYLTSLAFYYGLLFWGSVLALVAAMSNLQVRKYSLLF